MMNVATPKQVFICSCCNRRVATVAPDGSLILVIRHDQEWHETRIAPLTAPPKCGTTPS